MVKKGIEKIEKPGNGKNPEGMARIMFISPKKVKCGEADADLGSWGWDAKGNAP